MNTKKPNREGTKITLLNVIFQENVPPYSTFLIEVFDTSMNKWRLNTGNKFAYRIIRKKLEILMKSKDRTYILSDTWEQVGARISPEIQEYNFTKGIEAKFINEKWPGKTREKKGNPVKSLIKQTNELWNIFMLLPDNTPDEVEDFRKGIHQLQRILTMRIIRKEQPELFAPLEIEDEEPKPLYKEWDKENDPDPEDIF